MYPYLDLTIMPALRAHAVSARAAVLFSPDMKTVHWTNAMGADLLGADNVRAALDGASRPDKVMMRQLSYAAQRLIDEEPTEVGGMIRLRSGFKTKLVAYTLRQQHLPAGEEAVLLITDSLRGRSHGLNALAQETVDSLSGEGHGSALLQSDGVVLAGSSAFHKFGVADEALSQLSREMNSDADGLIKRPLDTATGPLPAGMSRLMGEPVLDMLIIAEPSSDMLASSAPEKTSSNDAVSVATAAAATAAAVTAASVAADTGEAEPAEDEAPRVGAFSNRRSGPKQSGPGKWYYKAKKADEDNGNGDDQDEAETVSESVVVDEPSASADEGSGAEQNVSAQGPIVAETTRPAGQQTPQAWEAMDVADGGAVLSEDAADDIADSVSEDITADDSSKDDEPVADTEEQKPKSMAGKLASVVVTAGATAATVVVGKKINDKAEPADDKDSDPSVDDTSDDSETVAEHSGADEDVTAVSDLVETDEDGLETSKPTSMLVLDEGIPGDDTNGSFDTDDSHDAATTDDRDDDGFRFTSTAKPVRFVWELDADNEFRSVSDDLAGAVGPKSADLIGLKWEEAAALRRLENGSEITELLSRGDTWSGKTVLWPVEGTDLRVPIDMAGLPSYRRNRTFDGFNGFGIIRTADAVVDPNAVGLDLDGTFADNHPEGFDETLVADAAVSNEEKQDGATESENTNLAGPVGFLAGAAATGAAIASVGDEPATDVKQTDRSLSDDERETFEEIRDRLRPEDDGAADSTEVEEEEVAPVIVPSAFTRQPAATRNTDTADEDLDAGDDVSGTRTIRTPVHDVDTSILSRLPIPVLVYRDDDLLFGNAELFTQTGHADLQALAEAGGVDALFGPSGQSESGAILHRDGRSLPLRAHLQRVPWDAEKAMLLTLRRDEGGIDADHSGDDDGPNPSDGPETGSDDGRDGDGPKLVALKSGDGTSSPTSGESAAPVTRLRHNRNAPHLGLVVPSADNTNGPEEDSGVEKVEEVGEPSLDATPLQAPALYNGDEDTTLLPAFGGLEADDLRSILDTATDGVIILSDEGVVRALNKSAEALFDVQPQEIVEQSLTRLLAPESHRTALDYVSNMGESGVATLLNDGREVIGRTAKGGLIPLFMTVGKLEKTDACCAVMRDITQFKKAEEELLTAKSAAEQANKQKSDFLAVISHEIRTPLNAIIGFSDMMIEERFGTIENDRYRGYLRDINKSGSHVLELINDLLDISKIESGNMELDFDACGLNTIVSETVAMAQADANKERIIIRTSLSAAVPKVVADERSLKQIILNLVSNSIKFTRSGGQVIVSTFYEESGSVVLRVRDTGIGMSAQELEKAMKPFQQISSRKNEGNSAKGSGLGLPLTKAMVEANRAEFHIESVPDEGTLVEVHFPIQRVLADR